MTDYITELLRLILESDNIEEAIMTASTIISALLKQRELREVQVPSHHQTSDQTSSPS